MKILKDLLVNNIELKVGSLLLAILLWLQISGQPVQRTLLLPVEFVNIPSEMEIANDYEREVEVVLRSRSTASFDERELAVVVDLRDVEPGVEGAFSLTSENILNRPYDVDVLEFTPARLLLQLDNSVEMIIQVTPEIVGQPGDGFEVTRVEAPEVTIAGPESRVEMVTEVRTEPLNIEGLAATVVQQVSIDIGDRGVRIDPLSVIVVVNIEEERKEVRLRRIPIQMSPEQTQVRLGTRWLEIQGTVPASFMEELEAEDFQATVNTETLEPRDEPYLMIPEIVVPEAYQGLLRITLVLPEQVEIHKSR
ncbi:MAG: CdaR family protein [Acidobacteriota bacterium]